MTDKEQIIIDGVDVSECQDFYISSANTRCCNCESDNTQFLPCKDNPNCYFKQLARKTQECEQLNEENRRLKEKYRWYDHYKESALLNRDLYNKLSLEYSYYRKALEEIKRQFEHRCDICRNNYGLGADCSVCWHKDIRNIINKAKDCE